MITSIGPLEALMVLTCRASWEKRKLTDEEYLIPCVTMAKTLMLPSRTKYASVTMRILNGEKNSTNLNILVFTVIFPVILVSFATLRSKPAFATKHLDLIPMRFHPLASLEKPINDPRATSKSLGIAV
jgi:hypothetical protein